MRQKRFLEMEQSPALRWWQRFLDGSVGNSLTAASQLGDIAASCSISMHRCTDIPVGHLLSANGRALLRAGQVVGTVLSPEAGCHTCGGRVLALSRWRDGLRETDVRGEKSTPRCLVTRQPHCYTAWGEGLVKARKVQMSYLLQNTSRINPVLQNNSLVEPYP
jgi:hypothetical protein